jgi:hypothetical protein
MGGKQLGFGDYEQSTAKKQTKKEKFLAEMDKVVQLCRPDKLNSYDKEGRFVL